jgi:ParB-like chromosome segregation protein Spo0J
MEIQNFKIADLIPYFNNARTHSEAQVEQIANSINEFGWTNPILVDGDNGIIAGHGRIKAAQKLGMTEVPGIQLKGLSDTQKRAYILADNRVALNAGWDNDLLSVELGLLHEEGFDLELTGFTDDEIEGFLFIPKEEAAGLSDEYSKKITLPNYEPKGEKPEISSLTNTKKTMELVNEITASKVSDEEKAFLIRAAGRHNIFDYQQIAEYYCHASPEMQDLMEKSALVLIDFDKAVSGGFIQMSKKLQDIFAETYTNDDAE